MKPLLDRGFLFLLSPWQMMSPYGMHTLGFLVLSWFWIFFRGLGFLILLKHSGRLLS